MANSKNTKKYRDEKKSGDLSALNDNINQSTKNNRTNLSSQTPSSEFISKYASSHSEEEDNNSKSVYASNINKSYGSNMDDESYTSQLGNDQRNGNDNSIGNRSKEQTNQLSYDQQFRHQQPSQPESNQPASSKATNRLKGPNSDDQTFNDQNNRFRSSFNTQGFGEDIYKNENLEPDKDGSGYAGSTFGGQGKGEFRGDDLSTQRQSYDNADFKSRQELKNPSKGFTRNYRKDERERNTYQNDEDGYTKDNAPANPFNVGESLNSSNSPYGSEREEEFNHELESERSRKKFPNETDENSAAGNFQDSNDSQKKK